MLSLALALAAITAPPEVDTADCPCTIGAVHSVAMALELMDPAEAEWSPGLEVVRERWRELADAPSAEDAKRFPDREMCCEACSFNWAWRDYMRDSWELWRDDEIGDAIREGERLYDAWDTARDAGCPYYWIHVRRRALAKLRDLIGQDAYYNGRLPPPVPIWHFSRID